MQSGKTQNTLFYKVFDNIFEYARGYVRGVFPSFLYITRVLLSPDGRL